MKKIRKNYGGSDLGQDFKDFFRREKKRIGGILKELGCTDFEMNYGFYYFSGFVRFSNGQLYYFSCSDVRHFGYNQLMIRTAKDNRDFTGGSNNHIDKSKEGIVRFVKNNLAVLNN